LDDSERVDFGLPGVTVNPGDHICAFFFGVEERDAVLLPFLRAGLCNGEKCMCIVDATEPSAVLDQLHADLPHDADGAPAAAAQRPLEVLRATEAYLRGGAFSTRDMIAFISDSIDSASHAGYDRTRLAGETTWLFQDPPGSEQFIEYESELNRFVPEHDQVVLCLYDLARFGGGMMVDLLRTHPRLLLGGMVIDNPHYLTPDEFRLART
jgi:hypothetical protein